MKIKSRLSGKNFEMPSNVHKYQIIVLSVQFSKIGETQAMIIEEKFLFRIFAGLLEQKK